MVDLAYAGFRSLNGDHFLYVRLQAEEGKIKLQSTELILRFKTFASMRE